MRIGIRAKVIALLTAVALLPLAAALATIVIGGTRLRSETFGKAVEAVAASEASNLETGLVQDVQKLLTVLQERTVVDFLAAQDTPLSEPRRAELDREWPTLPMDKGPLADVLNNPAFVDVGLIPEFDPRFREVLVTDRHGQLVYASGRTSDFYQGDEAWWRMTHAEGSGRVVIPPIAYDESGMVWSVSLCVPIVREGRVVGVAKAVLDATGWIGGLRREVGEGMASVMLVRRDGLILLRDETPPLTQTAGEWSGRIAGGAEGGWRITSDGQIQGFAPVRMPEEVASFRTHSPDWMLVLYIPESRAMGPVYALGFEVLALGAAIIGALFLAGLLLVDRSIVRRIRKLEQATARVAEGDFGHRVHPDSFGTRLTGADEIDELATSFNHMIEQVQNSHRQLEETNRMRMDFLRIASHELRTPISYIMGMARLLKESEDPRKLSHAVQAMGEKSARLSEIIQSMFKLMTESRGQLDLRYSCFRVTKLLESVYRTCRPFIDQRNQRLIIEGGENLPPLEADWDKVSDIVENLVMNAIKFTPDGGVIKVRAGMELGSRIMLTVQDQGPGISREELPHIYDPFYSGKNVMQHSSGEVAYGKRGMGLGLAIVKHFTEMHGGSVRVSTGENGSTFTVSIPVSPPEEIRRQVPPDALAVRPAEPPRTPQPPSPADSSSA